MSNREKMLLSLVLASSLLACASHDKNANSAEPEPMSWASDDTEPSNPEADAEKSDADAEATNDQDTAD